ncbi:MULTISPECIES: hypothetical protein [Xanthomonas]|uniref:Uncharacterized protein n=1 Tax=Xanthomonas euvesicatoria TaxID=456327 RepID=A0AAX4FQC9_XANEU|nr:MULTISPECIES: hypothetical protein [Xanthomonas]QYF47679.1 hypothetical protein HZS93_07237 [Xanthomonas citri]WOP50494.1 hypothetical protein R2B60_21500 [Xanthomonas euvesicatoria]WOP54668.1 hypothetical protein R5576_21370 [Xanthomonas euvesicatoria]WOP58834.1 hypothetical protein R5577_22580 [Xanthomonas euvesicatoria]
MSSFHDYLTAAEDPSDHQQQHQLPRLGQQLAVDVDVDRAPHQILARALHAPPTSEIHRISSSGRASASFLENHYVACAALIQQAVPIVIRDKYPLILC